MNANSTRRETPATSKTFTAATWDSVGNQYGRASLTTRDWATQHDLSVQLWNMVPHWDFETAASAVEAAGSHLPVLITWTTKLTGELAGKTEVSTGYAIIDYVLAGQGQDPTVRLRYSGFAHDVRASQVRTIEQVGVTNTVEDAAAE